MEPTEGGQSFRDLVYPLAVQFNQEIDQSLSISVPQQESEDESAYKWRRGDYLAKHPDSFTHPLLSRLKELSTEDGKIWEYLRFPAEETPTLQFFHESLEVLSRTLEQEYNETVIPGYLNKDKSTMYARGKYVKQAGVTKAIVLSHLVDQLRDEQDVHKWRLSPVARTAVSGISKLFQLMVTIKRKQFGNNASCDLFQVLENYAMDCGNVFSKDTPPPTQKEVEEHWQKLKMALPDDIQLGYGKHNPINQPDKGSPPQEIGNK